MEPPLDIAADLDTPVSAYLKLGSFQPRFLLESVEGGERLARYSFLGFGDAVEVRLDEDPADGDAVVVEGITVEDSWTVREFPDHGRGIPYPKLSPHRQRVAVGRHPSLEVDPGLGRSGKARGRRGG